MTEEEMITITERLIASDNTTKSRTAGGYKWKLVWSANKEHDKRAWMTKDKLPKGVTNIISDHRMAILIITGQEHTTR